MASVDRLLIVTAVPREAEAIGAHAGVMVVTAGVGRTNAACATTEALLAHGPFDAVLSVGVAGTLDPQAVDVGGLVIGRSSIYMEEGLITPEGFSDMRGLGFPLGDFEGNAVPSAGWSFDALSSFGVSGEIATVATCSGTDAHADAVRERTGAIAEAMEGAAVLHAARRQGVAGLEIRAISNTTGDRDRQRWDLTCAFDALSDGIPQMIETLFAEV
ncbi:MAG: futalosine hydrolase [Phycisphaerales bacterium]|nr:futalosine hydrolase [Phycisphaerales bacterium]